MNLDLVVYTNAGSEIKFPLGPTAKSQEMLRSGSLLWKQEQKEEATCNQKVVSEIEFHLALYTCYSLKGKKHYEFLAL